MMAYRANDIVCDFTNLDESKGFFINLDSNTFAIDCFDKSYYYFIALKQLIPVQTFN